jgi:hypothetical protein
MTIKLSLIWKGGLWTIEESASESSRSVNSHVASISCERMFQTRRERILGFTSDQQSRGHSLGRCRAHSRVEMGQRARR